MQYIPLLAQVEDQIVIISEMEGRSYSEYTTFHAIMAEASAARFDALLINTVLPLVGLIDELSDGIEVADVGCGSSRDQRDGRYFPE